VMGSCLSEASVRACEFCIWAFREGVDCTLKYKALQENEGQMAMDCSFIKQENEWQMAMDRAFFFWMCVCMLGRTLV